VRFAGILEPKWFIIDWDDGSSSEHNAHILRHLNHVDDGSLPEDVPGPPPPAVLLAAMRRVEHWPIVSASEVKDVVDYHMPGARYSDTFMNAVLKAMWELRTECIPRPPVLDLEAQSLMAVLRVERMSHVVVLGSAHGDACVEHMRTHTGRPVIVNHPPGKVTGTHPLVGLTEHLHLDPIGPAFIEYFEPGDGVDMFYVNIDPVLFDVVVPTLLEARHIVVCIRLPAMWDHNADLWRHWWLKGLQDEERVLWVEPMRPDGSRCPFHWLLLFSDKENKEAYTWPHVAPAVCRIQATSPLLLGQSLA